MRVRFETTRALGFASFFAALGLLTASRQASGADLIVNGSFVEEDFATSTAWSALDDKYGSIHQAEDFAPWSDEAPNYGAILRVCQDATDVEGASGGVFGAHIEQTVPLLAGQTYELSFWAAALQPNGFDPTCSLHGAASKALQVQVYGESSGELLSEAVNVADCGTTCGATHSLQFVAPANESATLRFFFGGQWAKLKLSGVALNDGSPPGEAAGAISVNQLGYATGGPKFATLRSSATGALPWQLLDGEGGTLASGTTLPFGLDELSGDALHRIDFGAHATTGTGLRLAVDGAVSPAFDIADDVYAPLTRDSLRFFYHQRCGQALTSPEVELVSLERAVDHTADGAAYCSAGQSCAVGYPLDVSKGWHDAGDYGKYVISGSIAVWALLDAYERASTWGTSLAGLDDGELNIGAANGVPDILDEARHELEFLLGMQVPEGNPLAGMAHHKYHSNDWVPMPTLPQNDASGRFLHPPSTAATLDLAATAAQCARVWRDVDAVFASRCLAAAERAWAAALTHPNLFAPSNSNVGGGPYDDGQVEDEFYWAAAELFITTGRSEFADALRASSQFAAFNPGTNAPFSWPGTAGLGTISLALAPSDLAPSDITLMRQAIVDEAERYLSIAAQSGYAVPLAGVNWGSNADALAAGIVFALAHDLTGEARFDAGATSTLDYVLGNNPVSTSFVTGYGSSPVGKLHHTTFAPYLDAGFPAPPPGYVVGGPNAALDAFPDPGVSPDCSPLRCWSEASGAYWFIEVAVNWNAPLAWLTHWLDERSQDPRTTAVGLGSDGTGGAGNDGETSAGGSTSTGPAGASGDGPDLTDPNQLDSDLPELASGTEPEGCGCRVRDGESQPHAAAFLALLALAAWRRRR